MPRKSISLVLLLAGALLSGALVLSCSKQEKAPAKQPTPPAKVEQPVPAPRISADVSVDFSNATLATIVPFVTEHTGKGFVLSGTEQKTMSWTEYKIPRDRLFDSFINALVAYDLVARPMNDPNVFTITTVEELKVPLKLDFATSARGTFFLLGNTIYPQERFPYPLKHDAGSWYAIVPKSVSEKMTPPSDSTKNANI